MVVLPLPAAVIVVVFAVAGLKVTTFAVSELQLQGWLGIVSLAESRTTHDACTLRPIAVRVPNELGSRSAKRGTCRTTMLRDESVTPPVAARTFTVTPVALVRAIAVARPAASMPSTALFVDQVI